MTTYQALADASAIHASEARSRFERAFTSTRWMTCALAMAALAVAYFALPQEVTRSVYNPMGATAFVAFFTGAGRVGNRRIWRLLGSGVMLYALADMLGSIGPVADGSVQTAASLLFIGAYTLIAIGLTAIIGTLRAARR